MKSNWQANRVRLLLLLIIVILLGIRVPGLLKKTGLLDAPHCPLHQFPRCLMPSAAPAVPLDIEEDAP
jgi:hypothetical protein